MPKTYMPFEQMDDFEQEEHLLEVHHWDYAGRGHDDEDHAQAHAIGELVADKHAHV